MVDYFHGRRSHGEGDSGHPSVWLRDGAEEEPASPRYTLYIAPPDDLPDGDVTWLSQLTYELHDAQGAPINAFFGTGMFFMPDEGNAAFWPIPDDLREPLSRGALRINLYDHRQGGPEDKPLARLRVSWPTAGERRDLEAEFRDVPLPRRPPPPEGPPPEPDPAPVVQPDPLPPPAPPALFEPELEVF